MGGWPKARVRWAVCITALVAVGLFAADEDEEQPQAPHPECTMFTAARDRIQRETLTGLNRDFASMLTEEVVNALPNPATVPGRSRSGELRQTPVSDNYIDTHIWTALQRQGIAAAPPASDLEFLRRAMLDLTGRIPRAQDVVDFVNDPQPSADKRAAWVDAMFASPEWADKWAMFFGDLFKNTLNTVHLNRGQPGRDALHYYLLDALRENKPYDAMTRELITASGSNYEVGAANFTLWGRTTGGPVADTYDTQGVNVATVFLGVSHMDCIMCHDGEGHLESLSLWGARAKRPEALGLAAFFARTDLNNGRAPWTITDSTAANRQYQLNTTTGNRPPRRPIGGRTFIAPEYPFGGGGPNPGENWREALARLVTADFQFARATVNYIWREFMVVGLVEPPDQFDPLRLDYNRPPDAPWTLQPSNPQLLDALARKFIQNDYNLQALMRDIVTSRAYQISSRYNGAWNPAWERSYARKLVRRLDAEEIHDAVALSSGVPAGYVVAGFREPRVDFAMQFPDVVGMPGGVGSQFLDSFLRGNRFDDDRRSDLTVLQALNLMNSAFVGNRVRNVAGTTLNRIINLPNENLVDQLYLHVLSRWPTAAERQVAVRDLSTGARNNKAEDLMWSLYNKVDFIFNY